METKTVMSLTERASVARASRDANIREAIKLRQERQSIHHVLLKASMYATLRHEVEAEDGVVNEAVNKGHDSVSIFNYYVPVNVKTKEGEDKKEHVELMVPYEQTYICGPDEDRGKDSTPIVTLIRGHYNRKTAEFDSSKLPGKQTVIESINKDINEDKESKLSGCVLKVEKGYDKNIKVPGRDGHERNAAYLRVMLVWDIECYKERQKENEARRIERRIEYKRSTKSNKV
uniref:Uncharacterized protein n=1 Tax=viral metagenome TaxID=1070528 RepID=A0A6C0JB31_9ZZZZ